MSVRKIAASVPELLKFSGCKVGTVRPTTTPGLKIAKELWKQCGLPSHATGCKGRATLGREKGVPREDAI